MTGSSYGNGNGKITLGDPDFVNRAPTAQFLDRYIFFADFTYPDTAITLVRRKSAKGFSPVELGCGGEVSNWQPIDSAGNYEFPWVELTKTFIPQKFPKGECGYGRIEAHSDGPFGVTCGASEWTRATATSAARAFA